MRSEIRVSIVAAPIARGRPFPQDASATFADERLDVFSYVAVQGLTSRGSEVGANWAQAREIAATAARTLAWNASRFVVHRTGGLKNGSTTKIAQLLPTVLANCVASAAPDGAGVDNRRWTHAIAGFFTIPADSISVLFACGPMQISLLFPETRTIAHCQSDVGRAPFGADDLATAYLTAEWKSVVGVVSCSAGAGELGSRGATGTGSSSRSRGHELIGTPDQLQVFDCPSFGFERHVPLRSTIPSAGVNGR